MCVLGNNGEFKPTNPKDRAATNRLDITLFPATAVAYGAWAMTEGDCKYGAFNYRPAGVLASVYVAAAHRHLDKWFDGGEECDPVSQVHHLASVLGCVGVLIDSMENGVLKDDRPPKSNLSSLLKRLEEKVKHLHDLYPDGPPRYTEKTHPMGHIRSEDPPSGDPSGVEGNHPSGVGSGVSSGVEAPSPYKAPAEAAEFEAVARRVFNSLSGEWPNDREALKRLGELLEDTRSWRG